jgi:pilus assembly protein Flp/PilA
MRYRTVQQYFQNRAGVSAVEYGLIAALLAVVIIGAVTLLGRDLNNEFTYVGQTVAPASTPP